MRKIKRKRKKKVYVMNMRKIYMKQVLVYGEEAGSIWYKRKEEYMVKIYNEL